MVEHCFDVAGVSGSIPLAPTRLVVCVRRIPCIAVFLLMDSMNKKEIISDFGAHGTDTGSSAVQIALLTGRINEINEHLKLAHSDHSSRVGLMKLVGRRRRLLDYVKQHDLSQYEKLVQRLGLRK